MRIHVDHLTRYDYQAPVSFGEHALYLRPRESQTLHVSEFSVSSEPDGKLRWVRDCFNNVVAVVNFDLQEASTLSFHCKMEFDVVEENPFDFILDSRATNFPFAYDAKETQALEPYLGRASEVGLTSGWVSKNLDTQNVDTVGMLTSLNQAVFEQIRYQRRDEEGVQRPEETLRLRSGSCRDMAELFVASTRSLGLAARFVSGYLYEPTDDEFDGTTNRAAGSMHAWAEVYLPGAGWRGFDPTNGILTDHHFLTAAVANRPEWVNPIQGKYFHEGEVHSDMHVSLRIEGTAS
ncbi:MAG: transglutaminase family protein [Myxococcota bacterium]